MLYTFGPIVYNIEKDVIRFFGQLCITSKTMLYTFGPIVHNIENDVIHVLDQLCITSKTMLYTFWANSTWKSIMIWMCFLTTDHCSQNLILMSVNGISSSPILLKMYFKSLMIHLLWITRESSDPVSSGRKQGCPTGACYRQCPGIRWSAERYFLYSFFLY